MILTFRVVIRHTESRHHIKVEVPEKLIGNLLGLFSPAD
jgi:ribosomal protein S19